MWGSFHPFRCGWDLYSSFSQVCLIQHLTGLLCVLRLGWLHTPSFYCKSWSSVFILHLTRWYTQKLATQLYFLVLSPSSNVHHWLFVRVKAWLCKPSFLLHKFVISVRITASPSLVHSRTHNSALFSCPWSLASSKSNHTEDDPREMLNFPPSLSSVE